jgi:hypothetical protein
VYLGIEALSNADSQAIIFPAIGAGLRFLPFMRKGRKQQKNLYTVKFFGKDSAADLTGATNPVHPVK